MHWKTMFVVLQHASPITELIDVLKNDVLVLSVSTTICSNNPDDHEIEKKVSEMNDLLIVLRS
jgi:hypothetical protein